MFLLRTPLKNVNLKMVLHDWFHSFPNNWLGHTCFPIPHTILNKVFVFVPIPDASLETFSISSLLDSWLGLPPTPWPPAGWDGEPIIC